MSMDLVLGTAQFGSKYGISNNAACAITQEDVFAIVNAAKEEGVTLLDTAPSYGNSHRILGEVGIRGFDVQSKISRAAFSSRGSTKRLVWDQVTKTLKNLRIEKLHSLLIHDVDQFLETDVHENCSVLEGLKSEGLVDKVGVSIYEVEQYDRINGIFDVDICQLPLNIMDRRAVDSGHLRLMKDLGIEIQARSIFLQGLLLLSFDEQISLFPSNHQEFSFFHGELEASGKSPIEFCLNFINSVSVDKVVVGVNRVSEFEQLCALVNSNDSLTEFSVKGVTDLNLIDPRRWKN